MRTAWNFTAGIPDAERPTKAAILQCIKGTKSVIGVKDCSMLACLSIGFGHALHLCGFEYESVH